MKTLRTKMVIGAMGFLCVLGAPSLLADGTETLGSPSVPIQPGTTVIAAGTGLGGFSGGVTQPQPITVTVPAGATVKQVLLYWEGDNTGGQAADNTITVNGTPITGTLIGGPTLFYQDVVFATFRADVTGLNLVAPGANTLSVGGLANSYANNGAGVLVIIDDGSAPANIGLRDGQDLAFWGFAPTLDAMVPQTFNFPAEASARTANLSMFFASAEGAANEIRITVNGVTSTLFGVLNNSDGPDWDTVNLAITVPAGATSVTVEPVSPAPNGASITWVAGALAVRAPNQPGCPDCVDPVFGLGAAAGCSVLELGPSSVSITGPAGGVLGDICIAPNGKLSMSGSQYITGTVKLGPGATFNNSSSGIVGGVLNNVDLSAEIAAAYAANVNSAALPCTQTFTKLDGKSVTTIVGVSGVNVICVQDVVLGGTQILLTGPADAKFIFNVTGKFVLTGGGEGPQIRVDTFAGLKPSAVLYNIIGTGADVAFSGGGGGVGCCAAIVDGTLLAPYRKIALSPGLVNGQVISSKNISIVSGSSVRCPCP